MVAQDPSTVSVEAPNVTYYTPAQIPASGTISPAEKTIPLVFQPLKIRDLELHNRIMVSQNQLSQSILFSVPIPSLCDRNSLTFCVFTENRSPLCASTQPMRH